VASDEPATFNQRNKKTNSPLEKSWKRGMKHC